MTKIYNTKPKQVRVLEYTGTNETEIEKFANAIANTGGRKHSKVIIIRRKLIDCPLLFAQEHYGIEPNYASRALEVNIDEDEKYYIYKGEYFLEDEGKLRVINKKELEENYDEIK